ncbi:hypothetical protein HU200_027910 [Digitaria exilis]|uniref:Uncharacterized protein n=1 Tax=Digitaria exilis TaxID=1010633 RepID=A0A835BT05_9POAL|nr:hypothetical protein HU200_027910 [Digitaria exilis]
MASLSITSWRSMEWFVICRPMASSMITCARSSTLRRQSSTSSGIGLDILLTKKFMDLVVSSPRTAEMKFSILRQFPQEDNTAGGE